MVIPVTMPSCSSETISTQNKENFIGDKVSSVKENVNSENIFTGSKVPLPSKLNKLEVYQCKRCKKNLGTTQALRYHIQKSVCVNRDNRVKSSTKSTANKQAKVSKPVVQTSYMKNLKRIAATNSESSTKEQLREKDKQIRLLLKEIEVMKQAAERQNAKCDDVKNKLRNAQKKISRARSRTRPGGSQAKKRQKRLEEAAEKLAMKRLQKLDKVRFDKSEAIKKKPNYGVEKHHKGLTYSVNFIFKKWQFKLHWNCRSMDEALKKRDLIFATFYKKTIEEIKETYNKCFPNMIMLQNVSAADRPEKPPVECDVCNRVFKHQFQFITHYRTHTGEKHLKCDFCEAAFSVAANKARHMEKCTAVQRPVPKP